MVKLHIPVLILSARNTKSKNNKNKLQKRNTGMNILFYTFNVLVGKCSYEEESQQQLHTDFLLGTHLASNEEKSTLLNIIPLSNTWQYSPTCFYAFSRSHSLCLGGQGVKIFEVVNCKIYAETEKGRHVGPITALSPLPWRCIEKCRGRGSSVLLFPLGPTIMFSKYNFRT